MNEYTASVWGGRRAFIIIIYLWVKCASASVPPTSCKSRRVSLLGWCPPWFGYQFKRTCRSGGPTEPVGAVEAAGGWSSTSPTSSRRIACCKLAASAAISVSFCIALNSARPSSPGMLATSRVSAPATVVASGANLQQSRNSQVNRITGVGALLTYHHHFFLTILLVSW